ncbi:MAG TPA: hypothetical protein VMQ52_03625 [Candidatus Saccharimonadales bacterium]|jgi:hypothetical protein|nr:hypothetical protein [Candidatus Saccharimonadales bacterium]
MFGHQDNQIDDLSVEPLLAMDNTARVADGSNTSVPSDALQTTTAAVTPPPATPAMPLPTPLSTDNDIQPPVENSNSAASQPYDDEEPAPADSPNDLIAIKQQALQQLNPLLQHLDQTPEEKFRTTMMMIQGADNKSLIPDAYQAAQQITDDKVRAQALLDVVNEINYFSQQKDR